LWWDKESKTVVTRADAEMEKLSNQDDDYNFLEMKIEVELPKAKSTRKASKVDDGLSTGSYSTFRTTATQKQQKQQQASGKKVQIATPTIGTTTTTDQPSVITMNTLSEQSFAQLVESVVAAIQANHLSNNQKDTKGPSGGQKAGQKK